jgi:hypothetical protein
MQCKYTPKEYNDEMLEYLFGSFLFHAWYHISHWHPNQRRNIISNYVMYGHSYFDPDGPLNPIVQYMSGSYIKAFNHLWLNLPQFFRYLQDIRDKTAMSSSKTWRCPMDASEIRYLAENSEKIDMFVEFFKPRLEITIVRMLRNYEPCYPIGISNKVLRSFNFPIHKQQETAQSNIQPLLVEIKVNFSNSNIVIDTTVMQRRYVVDEKEVGKMQCKRCGKALSPLECV